LGQSTHKIRFFRRVILQSLPFHVGKEGDSDKMPCSIEEAVIDDYTVSLAGFLESNAVQESGISRI
jgi:hypothetical protein